tara:strand:- start:85 stop:303 length:219 start_codon:yes stop_codon:yes gene_type:complete
MEIIFMGSGLEKLATLVVLLAALFVFILYIYACGLACLAALLDALPWCRAKKKPLRRGAALEQTISPMGGIE